MVAPLIPTRAIKCTAGLLKPRATDSAKRLRTVFSSVISEQPLGDFFRQRALKLAFGVLRPPDETPLANGHFDARRYSFHNCDCYLLRLTWCDGAMSQCRAPKQQVRRR